MPEEAGPQAGSGLLPPKASPAPHQVPATSQGSVELNQSSDGWFPRKKCNKTHTSTFRDDENLSVLGFVF